LKLGGVNFTPPL